MNSNSADEPSSPLFTPTDQKELIQMREEFRQYLPRGLMADIGRRADCSRQFVQLVLFSADTFDRFRSDKAYVIWTTLREKVREKQDTIKVYRTIIEALREGREVIISMNSTMHRFLERRLKQLHVKHSVAADHSTMPITYAYRPVK